MKELRITRDTGRCLLRDKGRGIRRFPRRSRSQCDSGDLGADVVKIESGSGDPERHWTTLGKIDMALPKGDSLFFQISNRNKKGIYLDIEKEKGREILHRLVKEADVFVTNLRKSTKAKLGIDYDNLRPVNPRIITPTSQDMARGFAEGPRRFRPSWPGPLRIDVCERWPEPVHYTRGDGPGHAIAASHAILTALFVRERSGIGQEVHVSLYGTGSG